MKYLVTGASGFLGTALMAALDDAVGLYRSAPPAGSRSIHFDLADTDRVAELADMVRPHHVDAIVHAAAVTPWSTSPDYAQDRRMAASLIKLCELLSIPRLYFLSGWNVYTMNGPAPYDEATPLGSDNDYGASKLAVEQALSEGHARTALTRLRLASVYGPGQTSSGLIPNLVHAAFDSGHITLGAKDTQRDYVYIDDVTNLLQELGTQKQPDDLVLNVGSGRSVSVLEVAQAIQAVFRSEYEQEITLEMKSELHEATPVDNQLDITKAQSLHLLQHPTPFQDGMRQYIAWRRREGIL